MDPQNPTKPPPRRNPPRQSSDSFPALEAGQEERLWEALKSIQKELNEARARDLVRQAEHDQRITALEATVRELRENALESRRTSLDVEKLSAKVDKLSDTVSKALDMLVKETQQSALHTVEVTRADRDQNLRILDLEAKLKESSIAAGKHAGLTWGGGAAVVGTILGALIQYFAQAALPQKPGPALLPTPPQVTAPHQ